MYHLSDLFLIFTARIVHIGLFLAEFIFMYSLEHHKLMTLHRLDPLSCRYFLLDAQIVTVSPLCT